MWSGLSSSPPPRSSPNPGSYIISLNKQQRPSVIIWTQNLMLSHNCQLQRQAHSPDLRSAVIRLSLHGQLRSWPSPGHSGTRASAASSVVRNTVPAAALPICACLSTSHEEGTALAQPMEPPLLLRILYQDEHIVAIEKPSGLYVHPPEDG